MSRSKASEVSRNEAYIEVRRSASGPEGLALLNRLCRLAVPEFNRAGDEGNTADGRFPTASTAP